MLRFKKLNSVYHKNKNLSSVIECKYNMILKTNIDKILKDSKLILASLSTYDILLSQKEFKKKEENLNFLMNIKNEVIK